MRALVDDLEQQAEQAWLQRWTAGPTEDEGAGLRPGAPAPDVELRDATGRERRLSEFWSDGPALVMFWRHFGCGCGIERARRLRADYPSYVDAGLTPVVVGQGEPRRAAAYQVGQELPCPVLCDPSLDAYRAYGIGQWGVERVLYDAPPELWSHPHDLGAEFQAGRRAQGRPLVDDPWRGVAEVVVGPAGLVRLSHTYQHCEDFPDLRVLIAAARLSMVGASGSS